jgi:hypothetical protein
MTGYGTVAFTADPWLNARVQPILTRGLPPLPPAVDDHLRGAQGAIDDFSDLEGDDDHDTLALIQAMHELDQKYMHHRSWDPAKHPRNPAGPGGGRFRSMVDRLKDAIEAHNSGDGNGHPFDGFNREQLRRVARARGIELKRGEDRESIAEKLLKGESSPFYGLVKERKPAGLSRPTDREMESARRLVDSTVKFPEGFDKRRKRAVDALANQAHHTPKSMNHLWSVEVFQSSDKRGVDFFSIKGKNVGAYMTYSSEARRIVLSPNAIEKPFGYDESFTNSTFNSTFFSHGDGGLEGVIAHEYGHHIDSIVTNGTGTYLSMDAAKLAPKLAKFIGASGPELNERGQITAASFDAWIKKNESAIKEKLSGYGATNGREFMAELWREYSTSAAPRPGIAEIGSIIKDLAERQAGRL